MKLYDEIKTQHKKRYEDVERIRNLTDANFEHTLNNILVSIGGASLTPLLTLIYKEGGPGSIFYLLLFVPLYISYNLYKTRRNNKEILFMKCSDDLRNL